MIDWGMALKLTIGGYGTNIIVLAILLIVAWGIGQVAQRQARAKAARAKTAPAAKTPGH